MRYDDWVTSHQLEVDKVLDKLRGRTPEEVVDYFSYDNMQKMEPDFCPLYAMDKKCHDMENLNCLYCACPHFRYSDDSPIEISEDGISIMSVCDINSRFAGAFNFEDKQSCDCSKCHVPHRTSFALKQIKV